MVLFLSVAFLAGCTKKAALKEEAAVTREQKPAVHFDFDKYDLKPEAQAILKAGVPAYLKYREYKLVVEGHA